MSLTAERLYRLLPAIHRIRDAQQGEPLRALLALLAEQFEALEEDIEQLYDDQFIETCADWVAPYIGDLIGYRPLHAGTREDAAAPAATLASPRAEVANTIAYRRRKGTAAMLEQLARDVTDWPARAVEFFQLLTTTQYMKHLRPDALCTADLRSTPALLQLNGAFDRIAHTAEMRRPEAGSGRYNIPNIGLFLWRLQPFALTDVPLTPHAPADPADRRFRLDPLGADRPLFRRPVTEASISHIAEPLNVPAPIELRLMAREVRAAQADADASSDYGDSSGAAGGGSAGIRRASVTLSRPNAAPALPPVPIDIADICVCDLRDVAGGDWAGAAAQAADTIALDPRLGRVRLGSGLDPAEPLLATFHLGFARPIGGGEYERVPPDVDDPALPQLHARLGESLQPKLDDIRDGGRLLIDDSRTYAETPVFHVDGVTTAGAPGVEVIVAARNGARPLLNAGGPIVLDIGARGRLVLDGLVIAGGALQLAAAADDEPRELVLRHCTLVPGLALNADGSAQSPGAPSLLVEHPFTTVTLDHCIAGAIRLQREANFSAADSIVDANAADAIAIDGTAAGAPAGTLTLRECTVVGKLHAQLLQLASNTLFEAALAAADSWPAAVWVERKQQGCVRFCALPADALVPRRFRCVPNAAHPDVQPHFTSLRYADPGYAQLRRASGDAILKGADDEGEIGVMHALAQPQREANLTLRLDEYLRFGLHAGIFHAT